MKSSTEYMDDYGFPIYTQDEITYIIGFRTYKGVVQDDWSVNGTPLNEIYQDADLIEKLF